MFKHEKELLYPVKIEKPNSTYAVLIQEQLGGTAGEFTAAMTYMTQSFRIKDPAIKDLFLDIAAEELCHMEMVATMVNMFNGHTLDGENAMIGSVQAHTVGGLLPALTNASGQYWTSAYVDATGDLAADLLTDIAAEQRAKVCYEYLYRQINDRFARETIDFLLNREEAHNTMFRQAFEKIQGTGSLVDWGVTQDSKQYFDFSTPGKYFDELKQPQPPKFANPDPGVPQH